MRLRLRVCLRSCMSACAPVRAWLLACPCACLLWRRSGWSEALGCSGMPWGMVVESGRHL
eukprot:14259464-Alexandrium_andersonii.AAC.1